MEADWFLLLFLVEYVVIVDGDRAIDVSKLHFEQQNRKYVNIATTILTSRANMVDKISFFSFSHMYKANVNSTTPWVKKSIPIFIPSSRSITAYPKVTVGRTR